ncbi:Ig-like domain repeat protein [Nocardioides daphniae]|uniref:Bacterial Ig-like domain-containing protein n=3 Tax=Nocardioides daphniae TaxID=402297 RepID=A0ABQ1Q7G6_9ACTN|nr:Ig-like domain repeat protein [Nocardioides daphniae]GGD16240.1 hypothetical protein GCM10007231_14000 [Nocardioides daphniae]
MITRARGRLAFSLSTAALLAVPLLAALPAANAAPSGDGWSVTAAPGGYQVTVDLDKPLPMRSDAPTLVVDGTTLGLATESEDGSSLSVFTTDPSVLEADEVEAGWASQSFDATSPDSTVVEVPDAASIKALGVDPDEHGSFAWTESIYKFGDEAIDLANIGGVRGELEGKVYLPRTGGARPVVMLLHGRHTSCYGTGPTHNNRWPCATAPDNELRMSIPSYAGYDNLAQALASHGYAVVSVSANAINSNDNQLAADRGAVARGQLMLDTLEMLRKANAGEAVSFTDTWTGDTLDLDAALTEGARSYELRREGFITGAPDLDAVRAADFEGRFDFSNIGMMGHSRGGEGVTAAATLNQSLDKPWEITSILPLAPVDFGRMTVPNVPMNVVLPYCDGDVSNQQGQHMLDDSRYAFGDDVLRSATWMMGTNHNFYNTAWTPGLYRYSVSDDWSNSAARRTDPTCGTDPSVASTSIRISAADQYALGSDYMTAWFRLTMGGEKTFLPMFDGTGVLPQSAKGADVRTVATAPSSARSTVASFENASTRVTQTAQASTTVCASLGGRTAGTELPACATTLASSQVPHWTPATNGGNVPATPVTRMTWTTQAGEVRVGVAKGQRDASAFDRLSVKMAADETVATATDLTLSVIDGEGERYDALVSELNPFALTRLPASSSSAGINTLKKVVLQQVNVEVADLAAAGLDVSDLREVRFKAVDAEPGAAYLSDLALESSSVGTADSKPMPVIGVYAPNVEEGNAPDSYELAVHLDAPAPSAVVGDVSVLGSTTGRAGIATQKVTFAPGETCKVVSVALQGDRAASATATTQVTYSVINTRNAVMGVEAIGFTQVREDDGVTGSAVEVAPFGKAGDPCAELEAVRAGGVLDVADEVAPGADLTVGLAGNRAGEAVTVTVDGFEPTTVVADGTGVASATVAVPADAERGEVAVSAVAAGTRRTAEAVVNVRDASTTTLAVNPTTPKLGQKVTLTATVAGGDTAGTVEFLDGKKSLGTAAVASGQATLTVKGFKAGAHSLVAKFGGSAVTSASQSIPVEFVLGKGVTATKVAGPKKVGKGKKYVIRVAVTGAAGEEKLTGKVKVVVKGAKKATRTVTVKANGTATLTFVAPNRKGKLRIVATYVGAGSYKASTSTVKVVNVR